MGDQGSKGAALQNKVWFATAAVHALQSRPMLCCRPPQLMHQDVPAALLQASGPTIAARWTSTCSKATGQMHCPRPMAMASPGGQRADPGVVSSCFL